MVYHYKTDLTHTEIGNSYNTNNNFIETRLQDTIDK